MDSSIVRIPPTKISIMPIVPKNPADQLDFYETHIPFWREDPSAVGLSEIVTEELGTLADTARAAYARALALRQAAESATLTYRNAVRTLHARGGAAIATIKSYAALTGSIEVYTAARIDPPRTGGPQKPVPPAPLFDSAVVDANGVCTIRWNRLPTDHSGVGPSSGNYYEILRQRIGLGETVAVVIGTAQSLEFRDPHIGPGENVYSIRARRGTRTGSVSAGVVVKLPAISDPSCMPTARDADATSTPTRGTSRRAA